ncbi:unnamed protein product [Caenorhabditis auriculariae]|uniref:G-protein coupled receptors family 1 profile domain-containing protein n=1 Tax=Caenorhabditis auriculariae TaxID=2777116 RepID=A0A8S1GV31_9PELO|nr:unnamed protein product [Caenorhabditis auriculariae]
MAETPSPTTEAAECSRNETYDFSRYALIVYLGTPIAVAGVICNWILFVKTFPEDKVQKKTPALYLLLLAVLDLSIDLLYIPFFTVDALAIYNELEFLYHVWHYYAMFLFGLSRMVQFASTYLIVCATIERFIVVAEIKSLQFLITVNGRYATIFLTILFHYMSYDYIPLLSAWDQFQLFNFYAMTVLHTFVPFILLLVLNISIVCVTKRKLSGIGWAVTTFIDMPKVSELIRKESVSSNKRRRDELRYATWTMVSIATTYLCCSSLSLFVSVLENVWPDNALLFTEEGSSTRFYTLATDAVSILVAVNSLLRIFVYMLCSPNFRKQLQEEYPCLKALACHCEKAKSIEKEEKFVIGYQNLIMGARADML